MGTNKLSLGSFHITLAVRHMRQEKLVNVFIDPISQWKSKECSLASFSDSICPGLVDGVAQRAALLHRA